MKKNQTIIVQNNPITVSVLDKEDYISLTDIAAAKTTAERAADVIKSRRHQVEDLPGCQICREIVQSEIAQ